MSKFFVGRVVIPSGTVLTSLVASAQFTLSPDSRVNGKIGSLLLSCSNSNLNGMGVWVTVPGDAIQRYAILGTADYSIMPVGKPVGNTPPTEMSLNSRSVGPTAKKLDTSDTFGVIIYNTSGANYTTVADTVVTIYLQEGVF